MFTKTLEKINQRFSIGVVVLLATAIISSLFIWIRNDASESEDDIVIWTFARHHLEGFKPLIDEWNQAVEQDNDRFTHARRKARMLVKDAKTIQRQMLSGFLSDVPTAEILILEGSVAPSAWSGPIEAAGLHDLTPLLEQDGLLNAINPPSLSPWNFQGHQFGLPHDVHPMLLVYRADIIEAAGIDVSTIETWDDWFHTLRPLMKDVDGDGRIDRYLFGFDDVLFPTLSCLYLQAGGSYFNVEGIPTFNNPLLAQVLAQSALWLMKPNNTAAIIPWQTGTRTKMIAEGYTLSWLVPDWGAASAMREMDLMSGKLKLMPIPAWEPGGRRTSVLGGSMSGITKAHSTTDAELQEVWELLKHLLMNKNAALNQYQKFHVISPIREFWSDPVYDTPIPYFCNQPIGRMYIEQAPDVPLRPSSPYANFAQMRCGDALSQLIQWGESNNVTDRQQLEAQAVVFINDAYEQTLDQIRRNPFYGLGEAE